MSAAEPRVLRVNSGGVPHAVLLEAAETLAAGGLIVLPTDTVYGLACRADDDDAVRRLYAAKHRPLTKALPLLLAESRALDKVATEISPQARRLAARFWPGPLTLVVRKTAVVSALVTAGQPTVGVRVPGLDLTRALLACCPFAVAVTSANLSEEDPACAIDTLPASLLAHVALVLDAGPCPGSVPSTVVDATVSPLRVLREGPITTEMMSDA